MMPGKYTNADPNAADAAFVWDGRDESGSYVGSGVYYCVLLTYGAGNAMTKIVVIR
jgi:flagellar hook assembly protein FlgD